MKKKYKRLGFTAYQSAQLWELWAGQELDDDSAINAWLFIAGNPALLPVN